MELFFLFLVALQVKVYIEKLIVIVHLRKEPSFQDSISNFGANLFVLFSLFIRRAMANGHPIAMCTYLTNLIAAVT